MYEAMIHSIYNKFNIDKRSSLYSLEPIAKETSQTEGLLSYICRLAEAHCIAPNTMFVEMLMPRAFDMGILKSNYKVEGVGIHGTYTADGIGNTARAMVTVGVSI